MHDATQTKDLYRFGQRELDQLFRHPFRKTAVRLSCRSEFLSRLLTFTFSTGSRRFKLPESNDPYNGTLHVTSYGPSCPQQASHFIPPEGLDPQALKFLYELKHSGPESEDCT